MSKIMFLFLPLQGLHFLQKMWVTNLKLFLWNQTLILTMVLASKSS